MVFYDTERNYCLMFKSFQRYFQINGHKSTFYSILLKFMTLITITFIISKVDYNSKFIWASNGKDFDAERCENLEYFLVHLSYCCTPYANLLTYPFNELSIKWFFPTNPTESATVTHVHAVFVIPRNDSSDIQGSPLLRNVMCGVRTQGNRSLVRVNQCKLDLEVVAFRGRGRLLAQDDPTCAVLQRHQQQNLRA